MQQSLRAILHKRSEIVKSNHASTSEARSATPHPSTALKPRKLLAFDRELHSRFGLAMIRQLLPATSITDLVGRGVAHTHTNTHILTKHSVNKSGRRCSHTTSWCALDDSTLLQCGWADTRRTNDKKKLSKIVSQIMLDIQQIRRKLLSATAHGFCKVPAIKTAC